MNDQEKNTGRTDDMDFSALDEELARMADETPEVPTDFHEKWTRMIREEAGAGKPAAAVKPRKGRGQLRYILSAAAAFVILVGGVVIARNNGLLQEKTSVPETPALMANSVTAGETTEEAETVYKDAAVSMEQTALPDMSADSIPIPDPEAGLLSVKATDHAAARGAETKESAEDSEPAVPMLTATAEPTAVPGLMMGSAAVETGEAPETDTAESELTDMAAGETEMGGTAEEAAEASETGAADSELTDMAAMETEMEETAVAAAEESAETPVPETGEDEGQEVDRSFLQQAWEGILDAVPWILGGAIIVLFVLTRVIRPDKKK